MSARIVALTAILSLSGPRLDAGEGLTLKQGDRVAWLGNGFIEQERQYAHLETLLVSRFPDADAVYRNFGWGGDTVRGNARTGGYQNPEGLARLLKEVRDFKPTVVFLGYGMNESFAGPQQLPAFIADYEQLLAKLAPLKARCVLLAPAYHEDLGGPLPDPAEHNANLEAYTAAIKKLAAGRDFAFVDLFHPLRAAKKKDAALRLTTNGILLSETGYALVARVMADQLRLPAYTWKLEIDHAGKIADGAGTAIDKITAVDGTLRFQALDAMLPIGKTGTVQGDVQFLRVMGLPAGEHVLTIDGQEVARPQAAQWQLGLKISAGPAFADAEKLRLAIVRKNEQFYRRWRPFNDHSRHWDFMKGDFALYDRAIVEQEHAIAQARRPRPHTYAITAKMR